MRVNQTRGESPAYQLEVKIRLDVEDWTDADVNIQYEIARDPHIMAKTGGAE